MMSPSTLDINPARVEALNDRRSPIADADVDDFLRQPMRLHATLKPEEAFGDAEYVIVSTPTDYNPERDWFDTRTVENVIEQVRALNTSATIVIKSTVPVGFTRRMRERFDDNIVFSPEFLREGRALYDNLHPSRIIVGGQSPAAQRFAEMMRQGAIRKAFVVESILGRKPRTVGVYRLVMKANSDNLRASAVHDVINRLRAAGVEVIVHEPTVAGTEYHGLPVQNDLAAFKAQADVIVANRMSYELEDVRDRVYTRDLFGEN